MRHADNDDDVQSHKIARFWMPRKTKQALISIMAGEGVGLV
jgi:hypothetical protein